MKPRPHLLAASLALALTLAACGPIGPSSSSPDFATVLPTAFGTGSIAGTITYGGQPLADARVELRTPDWRTSAEPVVAVAVSDERGHYQLASLPVGDYSLVAVWPDGQDDAAGYPAVVIAEGQSVDARDLSIERPLALTEPQPGAEVSATPQLGWEAFADADHYRVLVIDAGTTAMVLDQTVTGNSLMVASGLEAGRDDTWVVDARNAADISIATATSDFRVSGG